MFRIDNQKFGAFVAELRREKGMTQKELAERLFVSDKAVSKWERGLSLPDISLLQPMADIFGVSITELLGGERRKAREFSTSEEEWIVEGAVVALTSQEEARQRQNRRRWGGLYAAALACAVLETLLFGRRLLDPAAALMILPPMLAAIFGLHFCCFAKEKLPAFYDQYKVNFYSSGMMRMNVAGVYFNNSNWPHILYVLRVWCTATLAGWIPAYAVVYSAAAALLPEIARYVVLLLLFFPAFFGGLFGPVYAIGKKYE